MQAKREAMLPPDIEHRLVHQMGTFSLFGKVVELFVPNALSTCARLIDGDSRTGHSAPAPGLDDDPPVWRTPPRGPDAEPGNNGDHPLTRFFNPDLF